jgi:hypothetical protein
VNQDDDAAESSLEASVEDVPLNIAVTIFDKIGLRCRSPGGGMAYAGDLKSLLVALHHNARGCKLLKI